MRSDNHFCFSRIPRRHQFECKPTRMLLCMRSSPRIECLSALSTQTANRDALRTLLAKTKAKGNSASPKELSIDKETPSLPLPSGSKSSTLVAKTRHPPSKKRLPFLRENLAQAPPGGAVECCLPHAGPTVQGARKIFIWGGGYPA
jgi:hypothetical protein